MSPEEARIILLEDALIQSHHTVEFLHKCLTNKKSYQYAHPEQTIKMLESIETLVTIPNGCFHSRHQANCQNCQDSHQWLLKINEAKIVSLIKNEY